MQKIKFSESEEEYLLKIWYGENFLNWKSCKYKNSCIGKNFLGWKYSVKSLVSEKIFLVGEVGSILNIGTHPIK